MKLFDVVELIDDVASDGLSAGMIGTIVDEYTDPLAYEVEFVNESGKTIALVTLRPEQLRGQNRS
jgi:hypothetical protein